MPTAGQPYRARRPGAQVRRPVPRVAASGVPARGAVHGSGARGAGGRGGGGGGRGGGPRRASTGPRRLPRRRPTSNHHLRVVAVRFFLIAALVAAGVKLIQVQGFESEALAEKAEKQRITEIDIPAKRGAILDRTRMPLAFSVESRRLAYQPMLARRQIDTFNENLRNGEAEGKPLDFETETAAIAKGIAEELGGAVSESELRSLMRQEKTYVYLTDNVEPGVARKIRERFPSVQSEYRATREYPGGTLAANVIGVANWRQDDPDPEKHNLHGLSGLENLRDSQLSGTPGRMVVDTQGGDSQVVIPNTERDRTPAVDGSDIELTIDGDLQFHLQQGLADYVQKSGAKGGSAVVMDARTGEVYALANGRTFDPNDPATWDQELMGNPAATTPFEPGSVNKVVTALCAIENDITEPADVHQVRDWIKVADRTVRDAWSHPTLPLTTTGIFAKSSNVGTLMLAQQCGPDKFSELLRELGIGQRTGVGLPGESAGRVPPRGQWSGSTFGNLPIGQGLMMTVLQMAGMYQTVANDGVRVPPRIVAARITPDGERIPEPKPKGVRVVDAETARTVRDMFRAVVQDAPGLNRGTGPTAALTGYQISGKTGTGQQFDPAIETYSDSKYWITFAGILAADDPRFVVGIMLDQPDYTGPAPEGRSAAPLFHSVASYLAQRYNLPLSKEQSPVVPLVAP